MEEIVNEIYSQCEEKLKASQIEQLISKLEDLATIKWEEETEKARDDYEWDPYDDVQRENCAALNS